MMSHNFRKPLTQRRSKFISRVAYKIKGSLSNNAGDGYENVT